MRASLKLMPASLTAAVLSFAHPLSAGPPDRVAIGNQFTIDRTEVPIADFRAFAAATRTRTQAEQAGGGFEFGSGWERRTGWTVYAPYGQAPASEQEPAVHVSWLEATNYCAWRGGRLPTAEEWRMAAYTETRAAPTDGFERGRSYPYASGEQAGGMNTKAEDHWPRHAAVATTPPGINGLFDMGGNVWEWVADRDGDTALTAGGSWWYGPEQTTASAMQWKPAAFYSVYVGFRCAYASAG